LKILWFTNSPSLSEDYLDNKSIGRGWIAALEAQITKIATIELGVCFILDRRVKPFRLGITKYYPIYVSSPKGKIKKVVSRWTKPILNESHVQPYLEVIQDFKPDVIHIFGTEDVFGLIISKTKVPCVIHIQGNLIVCHYKWYSGLTLLDILKYSKKWSLIKGFGLYHNYWINKKEAIRERKIFQQASFFMGRTDWDRRITSVLSPDSKYFHCDELMRPEFYSHEWLPKKNKKTYVLITIIRKNIYKGLETIFESKRILKEIKLNHKIIWKIAGINSTDEISLLLERKYKSTFIENDIQLLGSLQEKELINEMLEADLFIHPSHIDNSPNSVCEAMLIGMPIITTFAGGIPSIIENKKEGLLVQDGDPYVLAGTIKEVIENNNVATELGFNARAKAVKRHDPDKIINDLLNIYSSVREAF
jgi:glycosyltransferase involved in cell wall biosynthesis